ncbi:unnamed protein product, partial [Brachionus calyciflorus]
MSCDESLKCRICKQIFIEPKFLPCGESACLKCLPKLDKFECLFCNEIHIVPQNGFTTNKILSKLLDNLNSKMIDKKDYAKELEKQIEQLNLKKNSFELEIIEHFKSIINEIDISA